MKAFVLTESSNNFYSPFDILQQSPDMSQVGVVPFSPI